MLRDVQFGVLATYVWLDETQRFHCKYRTVVAGEKPPIWHCDDDGVLEVILVPVCVVRDPSAAASPSNPTAVDVVVLCECNSPLTGFPAPTNTRAGAKAVFDRGRNVHPAFGMVQEYVLCDAKTMQPWQWEERFDGTALPRNAAAHCGVGGTSGVIGRDVALKHFQACASAGLHMTALSPTSLPAQWRFEMGPTEGLRASDELLLARFFLETLCEQKGLKPLYHPKPKRKCRGSACVVKYSNDQTRAEDGLTELLLIVHNLSESHEESVPYFGKDNDKRLDGVSASLYSEFGYGIGGGGEDSLGVGIAAPGAAAHKIPSVNIPSLVFFEKRGYFEDRRPGANCDPYTVTALIHASAVKI